MFSSPAVRLVQAYLNGRSQVAHFNGELSDNIDIISDVPQGSISGPLLFTMFINELLACAMYLISQDIHGFPIYNSSF